MKNLILLLFLFNAFDSFAQKAVEHKLEDLTFSAQDSVVTDIKNNIILLYGKATFQDKNVHFTADKISINKDSKKVVGTGLLAVASAYMIASRVDSKNKVIRYNIGEKVVSIE